MEQSNARMRRLYCLLWAVLIGMHCGCQSHQVCCDPGLVSRQLQCRTGFSPQTVAPCRQVIPAGVELEDGLSEDEAVYTALTNNSAFQATVAQLGMAGGDAVQASLLANPQFLIYFPAGAFKQGQYTLYAPIESFLLRPARVKVANREYRRVGEQIVQNGLNLARDVRVAHADFALAHEQLQLAREVVDIRRNIFELTQRRFESGDISELETITARVDMLNAEAAAGVQQQTFSINEARLATLIGLPLLDDPLTSTPLEVPPTLDFNEAELIAQALACRPDYHSARWAVAAASGRARLSRWLFLRLDAVSDTRSDPLLGTRTGTGLRFDLPIFNRNQGGRLRADWEVNAAMHLRDAIHDQIVQDVRTATRQLRQAQDNLAILNRDVAPALADALQISQKGFADGGTDYLLVLQTTGQYVDARVRILDQSAACRRALAELERSVGHSLENGPVDFEELLQETSPPADEYASYDEEGIVQKASLFGWGG
jgi:cobalt-zinc-cadmium efflux system outer membrane protein